MLAKTSFGRIIGGYTPTPWNTSLNYGDDNERKSFLFSLILNEKYPIIQTIYANYGGADYGATFGGGHDFYITNSSNTLTSNYFNFPHSHNNGKYVLHLINNQRLIRLAIFVALVCSKYVD